METNKNLKRTKVHRLSTDEDNQSPSIYGNIGMDPHGGLCFVNGDRKITPLVSSFLVPQHLYFTTDEEIKEGDWCLKPVYKGGIKIGYGILQVDSSYLGGYGYDWEDHHKIITTTDPKLRIGGGTGRREDGISIPLPQPSQDFIKDYCDQGGIDEVDVEYEYHKVWDKRTEELLEKYLLLKVNPIDNTITTHRIKEVSPEITNMASCMLSILDTLKLHDTNQLVLGDETLSQVMFRKMSGYNIDLNELLNFDHLKPITTHRIVEKMYSIEDLYMSASFVVKLIAANRGNSEWTMKTTPKMIIDQWIKENL